jgi:hypothetical protein
VKLDLERFAERIGTHRTATDVVSGRSYSLEEALPLDAESVLVLELAE